MIKKAVVVTLASLILATVPAFPAKAQQALTLEQKIEKTFPNKQIKDIENWRQYADDILYIVAEKMGYEMDESIPKPTIVTEMTTQEFSRRLGYPEDFFTAVCNYYFYNENQVLLTEDSELDSLAHEYVHYFQVKYENIDLQKAGVYIEYLEFEAVMIQRWFEENYMK